MNQPGSDHILTGAPVAAGTLDSTADLLDVLHDFFTTAAPATRRDLGAHLLGNRDIAGTKDPALAATLMFASVDEAAVLLHALADSPSRSSKSPARPRPFRRESGRGHRTSRSCIGSSCPKEPGSSTE